MQEYKSLHAMIMIRAKLVNRWIHSHTDRQTGFQPSELKIK